jgi:hypothetical protein
MVQVIEHFLSKHEALSLIPSTQMNELIN